jgi:hypothetical protein
MDTFIHYGVAAAHQAVADAGLLTGDALDAEEAARIGVVIGSGIGGLPMIEETHAEYTSRGPRRISPFFVPASIINMISGHVSMRFGFKGPNLAVVTAELARANAQRAEAEKSLQQGEAELDTEIANLRRLRDDIAGGLPPELLALYEKQRERYGIGAGLYVNGVSMATGMLLSESDADAIRHAESDDVLLCPESSCILVRPIDGGVGA